MAVRDGRRDDRRDIFIAPARTVRVLVQLEARVAVEATARVAHVQPTAVHVAPAGAAVSGGTRVQAAAKGSACDVCHKVEQDDTTKDRHRWLATPLPDRTVARCLARARPRFRLRVMHKLTCDRILGGRVIERTLDCFEVVTSRI